MPGGAGREDAAVLVAEAGEHAAPGRALQEAALQQVGLVDVLDGVRLLAYGVGQRGQTHRAAIVLLEDDGEDLPVHPVQTFLVHLEQPQGLARHVRRDAALMAHLGEIPDPLEQAVGYARRPARAQGQLAAPSSSMATARMSAERLNDAPAGPPPCSSPAGERSRTGPAAAW